MKKFDTRHEEGTGRDKTSSNENLPAGTDRRWLMQDGTERRLTILTALNAAKAALNAALMQDGTERCLLVLKLPAH